MRRPHALLALSGVLAFVAVAGSLALVACGGNDKPPLTPDNLEPTENAEAGAAPAAPGSATPSK
ncbi:MAG: hypothetical protein JWO86_7941 [Myxococcaceae bacterium]|jgi:hypothetical protein|nr:hypothetical protein [Myxococcaceae bacterium]MEA2749743.1 hypothetical protein [Myxococcales bacterium]